MDGSTVSEKISQITTVNEKKNHEVPKTKRRQQRQCLVEMLYMWEAQRDVAVEQLFSFYGQEQQEAHGVPKEIWDSDFVKQTLQGVVSHQSVLDEELKKHVKNWSFARIAKMDLAILRLALYELIFNQGVPFPVVINEAIELSKVYSSGDSKRFINGILDQVAKEKGRES